MSSYINSNKSRISDPHLVIGVNELGDSSRQSNTGSVTLPSKDFPVAHVIYGVLFVWVMVVVVMAIVSPSSLPASMAATVSSITRVTIAELPSNGYSVQARGAYNHHDVNPLRPRTALARLQETIDIVSWKPRVFHLHGLLSAEECDYIIKVGKDSLQRSKVASSNQGDEVNEVRTSYGTFINAGDDIVLRDIEERIALITRLPVENQEAYYLLRYENGQKYEPHHDYFHKDLPGMERYLNGGNQRRTTMLMYLSDPEEGGETTFPNAVNGPIAVKPKKGDAVLFYSMTPDGVEDPLSLHGSAPTVKGVKYALTKWIRIRKYH